MTLIPPDGSDFLLVLPIQLLQTKSPEAFFYLRISSNVLRDPLDWKLASNYLKEATWSGGQQ